MSRLWTIKSAFTLISEAITNLEVKKLLKLIGASFSFGFSSYSLNAVIKENRVKAAFRELDLLKTKLDQLLRKKEYLVS